MIGQIETGFFRFVVGLLHVDLDRYWLNGSLKASLKFDIITQLLASMLILNLFQYSFEAKLFDL